MSEITEPLDKHLGDPLDSALGALGMAGVDPLGYMRRKTAKDKMEASKAEANKQAEAVRKAGEKAAAQSQEAARQASRQQEMSAAREAAQGAAADAKDTPMETPDVQLDGVQTQSASGQSRKRRQSFGIGSAGSGVNI